MAGRQGASGCLSASKTATFKSMNSTFVGKVSLDNVMSGFDRFALAVLAALTTTRGGLFNNNAQSCGLPYRIRRCDHGHNVAR